MPELALETLLGAINALKAEVAGLSSGLRSAEDRIARLEAATYTPPISPSPSANEFHQASSSGFGSLDGPKRENPVTTVSELNSQGDICDVRRHLQPVTDGIATLTEHVLRIEHMIGRFPPSSSTSSFEPPDHALHTHTNEQDQAASNSVQEKHKTSEKPDTSIFGRGTRQKHRETLRTILDSSGATPRPVFGQISTPKRRVVSLNVAGSPFGSYVDERSPFSQLARKNANQSSVLRPSFSLRPENNSSSFSSSSSFKAFTTDSSPGLSKSTSLQPLTDHVSQSGSLFFPRLSA